MNEIKNLIYKNPYYFWNFSGRSSRDIINTRFKSESTIDITRIDMYHLESDNDIFVFMHHPQHPSYFNIIRVFIPEIDTEIIIDSTVHSSNFGSYLLIIDEYTYDYN